MSTIQLPASPPYSSSDLLGVRGQQLEFEYECSGGRRIQPIAVRLKRFGLIMLRAEAGFIARLYYHGRISDSNWSTIILPGDRGRWMISGCLSRDTNYDGKNGLTVDRKTPSDKIIIRLEGSGLIFPHRLTVERELERTDEVFCIVSTQARSWSEMDWALYRIDVGNCLRHDFLRFMEEI